MSYQFCNNLIADTASKQLDAISAFMTSNKNIEVDLSNILNVDSAGIALLIEIKNLAVSSAVKLTYTNTPPLIERLCQLYHIIL